MLQRETDIELRRSFSEANPDVLRTRRKVKSCSLMGREKEKENISCSEMLESEFLAFQDNAISGAGASA